MPDEVGGQCERCVEKGIICEGYDWPPPRHPAQGAIQRESNLPAGGTYPRRSEDPNRNNLARSQSSSASNPGFDSSMWDARSGRPEPRRQVQSSYGVAAQQNIISPGYSGYGNTDASFDRPTGNPVVRSAMWPNTQQFTSYQMDEGQGQEWYPSGQQNQRNTQSKRYSPY